jgi:hypothetical protein
MHGRSKSSTFHHGTGSVRHPACLSRPRLRKQARDYQRLCLDGYNKTDVRRLDRRSLACGWTVCGRNITSFCYPCLCCCRNTRKASSTREDGLEIWFLQIPDCQFISTAAPMQKWQSASPSKHDTGTTFVLDGSCNGHPRRLIAMFADSYLRKLPEWILHLDLEAVRISMVHLRQTQTRGEC